LDSFHELVLFDELNRVGSGIISGSVFLGSSIALPPILNFGSDYLK
jgi:hypothetical protein